MKTIDLNLHIIGIRIFIFTIFFTCGLSNAAWLVKDKALINVAETLATEKTLKEFRDTLVEKTAAVVTKIDDVKNVLDKTYKRDTLDPVTALSIKLKMPITAADAKTLEYSGISCPELALLTINRHRLDSDIRTSCEDINAIAEKIFSETRNLYDKLLIIQNKLLGYTIAATTDPGRLASLTFELQILQATQTNLIGMHMATLDAYKLNLEAAKYKYLQLSFKKVTN